MLGIAAVMAVLMAAGPAPAQPAPTTAPSDASANAPAKVDQTPTPEQELARVRQEMAQALAAMGTAGPDDAARLQATLNRLADLSGQIAGRASSPSVQLEGRNTQMIAQQQAVQNDLRLNRDQPLREGIARIRESALRARQINSPVAPVVSDFWLMQADLLDLSTGGAVEPETRQRLAIDRLTRFASQHARAQDPMSASMVQHVRMGLLRLYDQAGPTDKACALGKSLLEASPDDAALRAAVQSYLRPCAVMGKTIEARVTLVDGKAWSLKDHRGKIVVIHFAADWFPPSMRMVHRLTQLRHRLGDEQLAVLTVLLDAPDRSVEERQLDWSLARQTAGAEGSLSRLLEVGTLPRLVILDRQGRVAASGSSSAVLDSIADVFAQSAAPVGEAPPTPRSAP